MNIPVTDVLAILSIILGIVALIITVVGFFASLRFYRDGMNLQEKATNALTKIEEKTSSIQTQIGGMFDKTLDAAISNKGQRINQDFEDISLQIEKSKEVLIKDAISQIKNIGEGEKKKLESFISEQFKIINDQVNISQENTEDIISQDDEHIPISQFQAKIISVIKENRMGLSLKDISNEIGFNEFAVEKALNRLLRKNIVSKTENEKYTLNVKKTQEKSLLDKAFAISSKDGKTVLIAQLGGALKSLDKSFHPRNYGYNNLSEYLISQKGYKLIDNVIEGYNHPILTKE
ncbi:MAG: OST-HTH/LOTUS domain-containing protein [Bacteroidetes bacterium]|nr:OST-HTH/LOTUS domain-containing protein [Bacteroidota bacterium]MBU1579013.1 OST-HTH/LOTUS domain-containing protein [Bacteroidota bacterium]MBU2466237.1 OST-HTH/LOTUS domain-containing protein [Bacteroidota bacterium]MBU2558169.1 OST-HTH/LOTUS domain-containing protein [Bacteroidota bacterium]